MNETQQAKPRRWLKVALGTSLIVNVLLIGIGVGSALHHCREILGPHMSLRHLTADLPEAARRTVNEVMAAHRDRIHHQVREVREKRRALAAVLAAETVDLGALEKAFQDIQAADAQLQREIQAATQEMAVRLPVDARRELTRRMMRDGHRWKRGDDGDRKWRQPPPPPPPLLPEGGT